MANDGQSAGNVGTVQTAPLYKTLRSVIEGVPPVPIVVAPRGVETLGEPQDKP
jgi:hypothetical protein